jgi:BASS family bile acid:Na+ symporter
MIALGYFISGGKKRTRHATGLIEPTSNSGPCFAAVAIAFNNDPEILGALTGILLIQLVVGVGVASLLQEGRRRGVRKQGSMTGHDRAIEGTVGG